MSQLFERPALDIFNETVDQISKRQPRLTDMSVRFHERLKAYERAHKGSNVRDQADWWVLLAHAGAYEKLSLVVTHNFVLFTTPDVVYKETLGLLAVSRYVFELLVWLKTLEKNRDNGLVFRLRAVTRSLEHNVGYRAKTVREIALFKRLVVEEKSRLEAMGKTLDKNDSAAATRALKDVRESIDLEARREFSIYARFAQSTGYTRQAQCLENQVLPAIEQKIRDLRTEEAHCKTLIAAKPVLKEDWTWAKRARAVGMKQHYDFFYGYSSRLLHAEPASFATHQPELEEHEIIALLDHILVSILDAIELGKKLLPLFPK